MIKVMTSRHKIKMKDWTPRYRPAYLVRDDGYHKLREFYRSNGYREPVDPSKVMTAVQYSQYLQIHGQDATIPADCSVSSDISDAFVQVPVDCCHLCSTDVSKISDKWCFSASKDDVDSPIRYNSDSFQIAIDNCTTSCFTNSMEDFNGTPRKTNTRITGIGTATSTYVGTVEWLIVDNSGQRHVLRIPNTQFQAGLPFRLLCPQHVAQAAKDPQTTCLTLMDKVIFVWGGGKWKRTLPLHKSTNVGIMWSAPSNHKF
jgi:hypothetical protein